MVLRVKRLVGWEEEIAPHGSSGFDRQLATAIIEGWTPRYESFRVYTDKDGDTTFIILLTKEE